ncbi:MAG: trehalose 6-phosphate phosphatase [Solirubrobacteraceae bacterium]|nr:trehalose 6-phosphate phosphatase [Solirubrobacteraceae bacterium]
MTTAATLAEQLAPLRADPARSAVLLDVDGTLAPIVRHADDATVPESVRGLLIQVAKRYGVVACVSGRRASDARRIVSIGSIAYVGAHGGELLRAGTVQPEVDRALEEWTRRVQDFAREADNAQLSRLRVRLEDKSSIVAFHWRGTPDEDAARDAVDGLANRAEAVGLSTHWGRKVLEVRPPVKMDKGIGIRRLLRETDVTAALYAGDDATDLDAFDALDELRSQGRLETAILVGVASEEGPPEIAGRADLVLDGPGEVRRLLEALLAG